MDKLTNFGADSDQNIVLTDVSAKLSSDIYDMVSLKNLVNENILRFMFSINDNQGPDLQYDTEMQSTTTLDDKIAKMRTVYDQMLEDKIEENRKDTLEQTNYYVKESQDYQKNLENMVEDARLRFNQINEAYNNILIENQSLKNELIQFKLQVEETMEPKSTNMDVDYTSAIQELNTLVNAADSENIRLNKQLIAAQSKIKDLEQNNVTKLNVPSQDALDFLKDLTIPDFEFREKISELELGSDINNTMNLESFKMYFEIIKNPDNQIWNFLYQVLNTILGRANISKQVYDEKKLLMIMALIEGSMRTFTDMEIEEALTYLENELGSYSIDFWSNVKIRYPLISGDKITNMPMNLKSLITNSLSGLYRRRRNAFDDLSAMVCFNRTSNVMSLNTYRLNPAYAKSSIYIFSKEAGTYLERLAQI